MAGVYHIAVIDALDSTGLTALHIAAQYGNVGIVEVLLEHNADVMVRTPDGKIARELTSDTNIKKMLEAAELNVEFTAPHKRLGNKTMAFTLHTDWVIRVFWSECGETQKLRFDR